MRDFSQARKRPLDDSALKSNHPCGLDTKINTSTSHSLMDVVMEKLASQVLIIIEVSNDRSSWTEIECRDNNLNGELLSRNFKISKGLSETSASSVSDQRGPLVKWPGIKS